VREAAEERAEDDEGVEEEACFSPGSLGAYQGLSGTDQV
jgi:hypothetical protein